MGSQSCHQEESSWLLVRVSAFLHGFKKTSGLITHKCHRKRGWPNAVCPQTFMLNVLDNLLGIKTNPCIIHSSVRRQQKLISK